MRGRQPLQINFIILIVLTLIFYLWFYNIVFMKFIVSSSQLFKHLQQKNPELEMDEGEKVGIARLLAAPFHAIDFLPELVLGVFEAVGAAVGGIEGSIAGFGDEEAGPGLFEAAGS